MVDASSVGVNASSTRSWDPPAGYRTPYLVPHNPIGSTCVNNAPACDWLSGCCYIFIASGIDEVILGEIGILVGFNADSARGEENESLGNREGYRGHLRENVCNVVRRFLVPQTGCSTNLIDSRPNIFARLVIPCMYVGEYFFLVVR